MLEPSGHCPYLGLKQNQAIRFASPTPEHRCYASGQAQDIPSASVEYQARYCLSAGHVRCPLYTGSGLPSTPSLSAGAAALDLASPSPSLRGWFAALSARDRMIYVGLLVLLASIFIIYSVAGINLLRSNGFFGQETAPSPQPSLPVLVTATATPTLTPTLVATTPPPTQTPTVSPTLRPSLTPTATLTPAPTLPPTATPTLTPTNTPAPLVPIWPTPEPPTATPEPPTATPELPTATPEPPTATPEPPTATPELPTVPPELPTEMPPPARTPDPQPPPTEEYQF
nr:hypothetical protein [Oscillochloris trichoides]